jgi:lipopolysaccharide/colanic/teichoic acid biosynthesis glycosyltransferase
MNERFFRLIKFKTMSDKADAMGNLLPPVQRITTIGRILRATSLDEITQLWNVFIGDMSIIGPRPLLVSYLTLYSKQQRRRHIVRPGISGWAQVNGRNAISWDQKFEYDIWYVDNISFCLDIKIFFLTIKKVLIREGVNKNKELTMEPFRGSDLIS